MAKVMLSAAFVNAAQKSMFNPSEWVPFGNPYTLKDIWSVTNPGLYEEIDGELAEVTSTSFDNGDVAYRLTIPFKNGSSVDLKLSSKSDLVEGDKVRIDSIKGQELHKVGQDPIVRYDGELAE